MSEDQNLLLVGLVLWGVNIGMGLMIVISLTSIHSIVGLLWILIACVMALRCYFGFVETIGDK